MRRKSQWSSRRWVSASHTIGRSVVAAWITVAFVIAWTLPVGAQENDGADDAQVDFEAFREHVAKGAELRKQEQYREALAQFQQARQIADHPKLMLATGNLREAIGDCAGARYDMRRALEDGRGSSELRKKLVAALEENRQCVDRGVMVVTCSPEQAVVHVGRSEISCGEEIELTSGWHTLTARANGHRDSRQQVRVDPGGDHRHEIVLEEIPSLAERAPEDVPAWMSYGAYGSMVFGAGLTVAGLISDTTATTRQEEMAQAHLRGDFSRTERLVDEGESAQIRTAVLYTSGVVFAATGAMLWAFDEEIAGWLGADDDTSVRARVHVGRREATVGAVLTW